MKTVLLLLVFMISLTPVCADDLEIPVLKRGYIERSGKPVIEAKYSDCSPFSDGAALVKCGDQFSFIDPSGKKLFDVDLSDVTAIEPGTFHEGLCTLWTPSGTGYVDKTGHFVISPTFRMARQFSEGLAAVATDVEKWGYVDKTGNFVVAPQFTTALEFSEGLALVKVGSLWGYIDRTGSFKIKPKYTHALSFKEGVAAVFEEDSGYHYVDSNGKIAIDGVFSSADDFRDGIAPVTLSGENSCRYLTRAGKVLALDAGVGCCGEGMFPFRENGAYGFANAVGEPVIAAQYRATGGFSEGLAAVKSLDKWGYIDKSGKVVIPFIFSVAYSFSGGRAVVEIPKSQTFHFHPGLLHHI